MNLDDNVCYCFHVTRRKLMNFCRVREPRVASQLSECGGAGTGCGWCVPFLKMIFRQWQHGVNIQELEEITAMEYAQRRAAYIRAGKGKLPRGVELLSSEPSEPRARNDDSPQAQA
ncbi:MAG: (2Fe-2S)-binding protein [Gemmatales bacterium]|nr:(2Fe-2S)-binding protein [Gemmatales bacterium]MCS7161247.1 (2Fe-2S)-binding protein [Gemmatales bacterium]MDW8176450.1 (2Fe-2S)-binding protein [Gemmatales bacterium]MDW8222171.1 (2Fe-2S)-binding protein [Gemmatales bacterium]